MPFAPEVAAAAEAAATADAPGGKLTATLPNRLHSAQYRTVRTRSESRSIYNSQSDSFSSALMLISAAVGVDSPR